MGHPKNGSCQLAKILARGGTPTNLGGGGVGLETVCIDVLRGVAERFSCAAAIGAGLAA